MNDAFIDSVWNGPFGVAAQCLFVGGGVVFLALLVFRYKLKPQDALLAMIGLKPVAGGDLWLAGYYIAWVGGMLGLMFLSVKLA
ncbi:MAG: hypothetical protein AB8C02_09705 [Halioglobus sp.]